MTTPDTPVQNVVLTGFMGTGKTTVGRLVAELFGWSFVDTDVLMEQQHGPIPSLFEEVGEVGFRAFESDIATQVAAHRSAVIATGGGLLVDRQNAAALGKTGRIYCLVADPNEILRRLDQANTPYRPLLGSGDRRARIVELLEQRAEPYSAFEQIHTDGRSPKDVADEIHTLHRG